MALRKRLAAAAAMALAATAFTAVVSSPASARPQVECEVEGDRWECWLANPWAQGERWYLDGVHLPSFDEDSNAWGSCSPGRHYIRITWDGGSRTSTDFTCS